MIVTPHPFLMSGRVGRWQWPWAVLGTIALIVCISIFVGIAVSIEGRIARDLGRPGGLLTDKVMDLKPGAPERFFGLAAFGLALIFAAAVVIQTTHHQKWRQIISPTGQFDWRLFAKTASAVALVATISSAIAYVADPTQFKIVPRTVEHIPWLLLGMFVILLQAFGEDYAIKGYLLRVWGAVVPYSWVVVPLVVTLFTALHLGNADFLADPWVNAIRFAMAEGLALFLYLRTLNLAVITGWHWMNNVWAFCIMSAAPHQAVSLTLFQTVDNVTAGGGERLQNPLFWMHYAIGFGLLAALLFWSRSPFYLPAYRDQPDDHRG